MTAWFAPLLALSASPDMASVQLPTAGLSLSIPTGWQQVPTTTLDQAVMDLRKRAPNAKVNRPVAAFQKLPLTQGELTYPYILVYVFPSRPPTLSELKAMTTKLASQQIAGKMKESTNGFISAAPSFSFDDSTLRVKGAFVSTVGDVGSVANYVEFVPSSNGVTSLNGYMLGSNVAAAQQFYGPIFDAAQMDTAHAYSPGHESHSLYQPFDWSN